MEVACSGAPAEHGVGDGVAGPRLQYRLYLWRHPSMGRAREHRVADESIDGVLVHEINPETAMCYNDMTPQHKML